MASAIDVLSEAGYSGFSFVKVCEHANLSRGAIHHHYDTPYELLSEVVSALYERLSTAVSADRRLQGKTPPAPGVLIDVLWTYLREDDFRVLIELRAAAASDPTLAEAVAAPNDKINQSMISNAVAALAPHVDEATTRVIFAALTGLALQYFTMVRRNRRRANDYAKDFIKILKGRLNA